MTRRLLLCGLGALPAAGAKLWDRPAFPDWDQNFVDDILTDSPWARSSTVNFLWQPAPRRANPLAGSLSMASKYQIGEMPLPGRLPRVGGGGGWPGGGGSSGSDGPRPETSRLPPAQPVRTEMYLTTRFASALPVRQALALIDYGREGLDNPKAAAMLRDQPKECVVEIGGIPAISIQQGAKWLAEEFAKSARLSIRGRQDLTVIGVDVPEHGTHLIATLRFPRFADLSATEGTVSLSASAGAIRIEQQFKLKNMVYRDRLEL